MKKLQSNFLLALFFSVSLFAFTACGGNSSSNNGENGDHGGNSQNKEQFSSKVNNFDSTMNERVKLLNQSIHQWDSSAQERKGVMKERMEEKISNIKDQRDSLVDFLSKSKAQTEASWKKFQQSAIKEYKDVVESVNDLNKK